MVRMAGCNLSCSWCDTPAARSAKAGRTMSLQQVRDHVIACGCPRVEVTGGEPLLQAGTPNLLASLCDDGMEILLETNGSIDISGVDRRVRRIVDVKCPTSGMADRMTRRNMELVGAGDEVKFVVGSPEDFDFAANVVEDYTLTERTDVIFSPVCDTLEPSALAGMILSAGLNVRVGLQIHKILWPHGEPGHIRFGSDHER